MEFGGMKVAGCPTLKTQCIGIRAHQSCDREPHQSLPNGRMGPPRTVNKFRIDPSVDQQRLLDALQVPGTELGVLPPWAALKPRFTLHLYDRLASTNQQAWELVAQGAGAGTVVIAREQVAGRGQWGRTWVSPPGGLYLSLVLEPDIPLREATLLTLASAWGILTSCDRWQLPLQIKWPNDLVAHGAKVGGILTETRMEVAQGERSGDRAIRTAVIGIGINWANPTPANGISLRELLPDPLPPGLKTLEQLAAIVLRGVHQGYHAWQQQGTATLIAAYQTKLSNLGQIVERDGHLGRVLGVSANGDLTVAWDTGPQKSTQSFKPGEISLGYNT